ncbi:hypothetical protein A3C87_03920 [Candidatus Kaiserbacteria bacterium RIFCSPHIGHO2_02_FULL_49_34]|uniref:Uncharacterized protein n=1 Tax=Candidatus Kaiserbacteria bacterium RIFCSPHIGHO2_02_FULL_49_34 TaxID=1798491 RepID=A0A1F6DMG9_9BACT|nr:MAG: hypothetical protein A3C87_03920 [Candidatus Kaiserbacteria bacterium RIFCSPHIGHO2_02_FULL_49_34]
MSLSDVIIAVLVLAVVAYVVYRGVAYWRVHHPSSREVSRRVIRILQEEGLRKEKEKQDTARGWSLTENGSLCVVESGEPHVLRTEGGEYVDVDETGLLVFLETSRVYCRKLPDDHVRVFRIDSDSYRIYEAVVLRTLVERLSIFELRVYLDEKKWNEVAFKDMFSLESVSREVT